MKKIQFTYQKWFLRVILVPVFLFLLAILLTPYSEKIFFNIIYLVIAFICIHFYFKFSQKYKWFYRKGFYWVEDNIVFIEKGKKIYKLTDVKAVLGLKVSCWGYAKSGMLRVDYGRKKLAIVSTSKEEFNSFSECELFPLFETVLEYNSDLQKEDGLDFGFLKLKENEGKGKS